MNFLSDVSVPCEECGGARYNDETLDVTYKDATIADVPRHGGVGGIPEFFEGHTGIRRRLKLLRDVGLGYMTLGQPSTTLSGGEAQRVKLAEELGKKDSGETLYLLDEPTTGLHPEDERKLIDVLHRLTDNGNTVVVIEHELDLVKTPTTSSTSVPRAARRAATSSARAPTRRSPRPRTPHGRYLRDLLLTSNWRGRGPTTEMAAPSADG